MRNPNNNVSITGNLTRDGEVRQAGEKQILELGIAVTNAGGRDVPGFFNVKVWLGDSPYVGKAITEQLDADVEAGNYRRGRRVSVDGRLQFESWETDGQKRNAVTIVADSIRLWDERQAEGETSTGSAAPANKAVPESF